MRPAARKRNVPTRTEIKRSATAVLFDYKRPSVAAKPADAVQDQVSRASHRLSFAMASWWFILFLSQAVLQHSSVDGTFDIGLRWLRGDSSLFSSLANTTATTVTTETTDPRTTPVVVASTAGDALHESHTAAFRDDVVMATTTTTDATMVTTGQITATTNPTETNATSTGTAQAMILVPDATPVSLDDLALQVDRVPDPVLHLVVKEDGSHSFVVVSGRRGPTTVPTATTTLPTTAAETNTPDTTTSSAGDASTSPFTTIAVPTTVAAPNTTSPYLTLLRYLRPFIFGRLGAASTASSTEATTVVPGAPSTPVFSTGSPPWLEGVSVSKPVTTEAADPGLSASLVPTAAAARNVATADTFTTETIAVTPTLGNAAPATVVIDPHLASYPAEFRATELPYYSTTPGVLGYANASFAHTSSPIGEPSARATAFDTTIATTPVLGTTETPTLPRFSDYVSTTVANGPRTVPVTHDAVTTDVPRADDAPEAPTPRFVSSSVAAEPTAIHTTPVPTRAFTNDVHAALAGASPTTTEGGTSTYRHASPPDALDSLTSRRIAEATSVTPPIMGYLRQVTFAPWPTTAPNGGDTAGEPKYRYFYDPAQVMQVL
ncbi:mucin-2-like [Dermacentor albipictus]|uniref:mucin-2-like n=1 Tax=Dermacentor albipictus TaxID=60249 RepID=UPI0038FD00B4